MFYIYSSLFSFISFAQRIYKYDRVKIAPKILTKHLEDELFCEKSKGKLKDFKFYCLNILILLYNNQTG